MGKIFSKYLKLYYYNNKLYFRSLTIYKVNFVLDFILDLISIFLSIFFYKILYLQINNIEGWKIEELYLLVITVKIVNDLYGIFFRANLAKIPSYIRSGNLDYLIIMPVNLFFLLTSFKMNIKGLVKLFVSLLLFGIVYFSYDFSFPLYNFGFYGIMILYAVLIRFCFSFLISLLSFYFIRITALTHFFASFFALSTFPETIYKSAIFRKIFTYLIPVIIIGNIPVKTILKGMNFYTFLEVNLLVLALFIIAIRALKRIIKKYSSASS